MSWHCKKCDSDEVETQEWVSPNTGISSSDNTDIDTKVTWCKMCQEGDLGIVWKDDP